MFQPQPPSLPATPPPTSWLLVGDPADWRVNSVVGRVTEGEPREHEVVTTQQEARLRLGGVVVRDPLEDTDYDGNSSVL